MPITRQVKNVVKNYSNVEVKVREATSNDPWGPSSSLMADVADQTYNVVAFSEIMIMIWKRLNDHGKNWRHVYKSLVLLDYILKTGSERVAQHCRENIFAIQTLKDFQFIDRDGKDQGMNVREKSKQLVALLKDDERLKHERTRALKAKERLAQTSGGAVGSSKLKSGSSGSTSDVRVEKESESPPVSRSWEPERRANNSEIEKSRPSNESEEQLQLQLALALSQQEANETKEKVAKDEQRFQIALNESRQSVKRPGEVTLSSIATSNPPTTQASDPWDTQPAQPAQSNVDPWGAPQANTWGAPAPQTDAWGASAPQTDTWGTPTPQAQPWGSVSTVPPSVPIQPVSQPVPTAQGTGATLDPWGSNNPAKTEPSLDPWAQPDPFNNAPPAGGSWNADPFSSTNDTLSSTSDMFSTSTMSDPWTGSNPPSTNVSQNNIEPIDISSLGQSLPQENKKKDLLSDHSTLVNLDSLVSIKQESNPFFTPVPQQPKTGNPFAQEKQAAPSLNQLRTGQPQLIPQTNPTPFGDALLPAPLIPTASGQPTSATGNPFL
ncbi:epsin-2-like [Xenia sp. Carnegie-2017]|uniref:epsin-2-like n=1 Tax=Xenia sp. Carnegie-2017 TaxID=2897299 RepID=UPI001F035A9F|nr:epsin-2-like [Xenia sp. Carnegie-2017]